VPWGLTDACRVVLKNAGQGDDADGSA
jgi:hypothetical protein